MNTNVRVTRDAINVSDESRAMFQRVPAQPNVAAATQSGAADQNVSADALKDSMQNIGKYLKMLNEAQVHINYDQDIDRIIVKYVSKENREVIHQIPSKDFVEFEKSFIETVGLLFDKKV